MMVSDREEKQIAGKIKEYAMRYGVEKKEIVIFGCTPYARSIREAVLKADGRISAIIDNNPAKCGQQCLGLPVWSADEYLQQHKKDMLAVVCSKYYQEMIGQIKKNGYGEENIINIHVEECEVEFQDSEEEFEDNFKQAQKGWEIYGKICMRYPQMQEMFVCPYPGSGDIYMACSLFMGYCREKKIGSYVFVVIGAKCCKVAELFHVSPVEAITKEDMEVLLKAWEFLGKEKMRIKPLLHWGWRTKRFLSSEHHPQVTFAEMFQYDVYANGKKEKLQHYIPRRNMEYIKRLFWEKGLKSEKTIVMAPYAGSFVSEMSFGEWSKLAFELKKMGYDVCTNCGKEEEIPITDTVPISFPYSDAVALLEYAGGFIALRSGLCDVVSQSACKMVIFYESGFNAASHEYFSLRKMGLKEDVVELIVGRDDIIKECLKVYGKNTDPEHN